MLPCKGEIIMQNRQNGHRVYLSLLAAVAVLCIAAGLVWFWRGRQYTAVPPL